MDSKEPPNGSGASGGDLRSVEQREIDRRRDELLSNAQGGPAPKGASGGQMAGLGLQFVISILLCLYAGMWLDKRLGTGPWLLLTGVVVGASVGFYAMYRAMMAEDRRIDKTDGK
jgi:ATP synthase protein I